ncbi:hypothetical protein CH256_26235 [Rhodococcus sp. 05-2254-6]|uniref:hypothetical protein n=1 Tax=Rhodococcus sp. 05-2254-6 TaxID=2022489 RepID=UPI000B9B4CDE|nr:hypothetical protein [Rhodococcus sp. 05-2254-6]OZE18827.1 hypothetical protein CH256_26235 [Rhodococcus sp. 05-2254-6]
MRLATGPSSARVRPEALTFADVPTELRPSNWRQWLRKVTKADIREALGSGIEKSRAREMAVGDLQGAAYCAWLADHDLTTPAGRPARGWDSTSLARWEDSL